MQQAFQPLHPLFPAFTSPLPPFRPRPTLTTSLQQLEIGTPRLTLFSQLAVAYNQPLSLFNSCGQLFNHLRGGAPPSLFPPQPKPPTPPSEAPMTSLQFIFINLKCNPPILFQQPGSIFNLPAIVYPRHNQLRLVGERKKVPLNKACYEALLDEAWLVLVGRSCSMKLDKEALPDRVWSIMIRRKALDLVQRLC